MSRSRLRLALVAPFVVIGCQDALPTQSSHDADVTALQPVKASTSELEATAQGARVIATGTLQKNFGFELSDLDGADITVTYVMPDLGVSPDHTSSSEGSAEARFDVVTVVTDIVNRPNGAPDLLGYTGTTTIVVDNHFPPSGSADLIRFERTFLDKLGEPRLILSPIALALDGTQDAISGTDPVTDLAFLPEFGPALGALNSPILSDALFSDEYVLGDLRVRLEALTPVERVEDLSDAVGELESAGSLGSGESRSLVSKLDAATARLNDGNTTAAVNQLNAFIKQVEAFIDGGVLTSAEGQPLIDETRAVIDSLS